MNRRKLHELISTIEKKPYFNAYAQALKEKNIRRHSSELLQLFAMQDAMSDKDFMRLLNSAARELLFIGLDDYFKGELEKKGKMACKSN